MTEIPASSSSRPVAIITGAAQSIGRRTAELFAERGFDLVLSDLVDPSATVLATTAYGASVEVFWATCPKKSWSTAYLCIGFYRAAPGFGLISPSGLISAQFLVDPGLSLRTKVE